ncbi:TAXI family TRAP transporter solute-binding subunit [Benzoatithermus flavus]|uniref:TAXI family TRAP transporter solute-binding subunit n=1 Tax=Benzoatithermus flavus TaxID=3108223 RepID=A0ABU8XRW1_9PROT
MDVTLRRLLLASLAALGLVSHGRAAETQPYPLAIATGGVTGVYYQIGAAICRLLKDHPPQHPIDCTTEGSNGSVRNLIDMRWDHVPLAIAQSDSLYYAVTGTGPFAGTGPDRSVRALFSLVTEAFVVMTRGDSPVPSLAELKGKRLSIGPPASGTDVTFRRLMAARGWSAGDFRAFPDIKSSLQAAALCRGDVDAIAVVGANPSPSLQEATHACNARFVPISFAFAQAMIERHPYYVSALIPGGLYPNNPNPTETVGVRATLVAPAGTPDEVVYEVTRAVFDNLAELKTLHLAFAPIEKADIVRYCVFAPIHAGAQRYYREQGLKLEACPAVR